MKEGTFHDIYNKRGCVLRRTVLVLYEWRRVIVGHIFRIQGAVQVYNTQNRLPVLVHTTVRPSPIRVYTTSSTRIRHAAVLVLVWYEF